jgi:hypothetical protein
VTGAVSRRLGTARQLLRNEAFRLGRRHDDLRSHAGQFLSERLKPFEDRGTRFDTSFWQSLIPIDQRSVDDLVESLAPTGDTVDLDLDPDERWRADVETCHSRLGVRPISFSYPGEVADPLRDDRAFLSAVVPGHPYAFSDPREYYDQYRRSDYAITHRKWGWDCFRHLEILANGCIPLMVDVAEIPPAAMVHYPKAAMSAALAAATSTGARPSADTQRAFREYTQRTLTTAAMARYVLAASGHPTPSRVLFVDTSLRRRPDYLSVFTLIGLKQILGPACDVLSPAPYVYADWTGPVLDLYGRGFGYARTLDPSLRSPRERGARARSGGAVDREYDLVVVGNIARNGPLAHRLLRRVGPEQTAWVHGEDQPPSAREMHVLRASGTSVFVRSLHD